jgi:hypothetical protein
VAEMVDALKDDGRMLGSLYVRAVSTRLFRIFVARKRHVVGFDVRECAEAPSNGSLLE